MFICEFPLCFFSTVTHTINSISVHPGAVNTDIQNQWEEAYDGPFGTFMKGLSVGLGRSPEQGSYSGLYAALSPDIVKNNWNGVYLSDPVC